MYSSCHEYDDYEKHVDQCSSVSSLTTTTTMVTMVKRSKGNTLHEEDVLASVELQLESSGGSSTFALRALYSISSFPTVDFENVKVVHVVRLVLLGTWVGFLCAK